MGTLRALRSSDRTSVVSAFLLCCLCTAPALAQMTAGSGSVAGPVQPFPIPDQFGAFQTPPYAYDQIRGEIVNLETQQVKPIMVTADGQIVAVGNDADGRVVFYDADLNFLGETRVGQGICAIVERPGLGADVGEFWVTTSHQTATLVIDRATFRVTHVIRPTIAAGAVGAGHASTPAGLDFNRVAFTDPDGVAVSIGGRAYVAGGTSNALIVIDATLKAVHEVIELLGPHNGRDIHLNEPRAVVQMGGFVYVSSHLSGNQTTTSTSLDVGSGGDVLGPLTGATGDVGVSIIDLSDDVLFPTRSLPDFDVARYDLATGTILMVPDLLSVGFGIVAHPGANRIAVSGFRSRNGEFTGEGAFPAGSVVKNGIGMFRIGNPLTTQGFLVTEDLGPAQEDLVLPIDMAVDAVGRLHIAAYGGSRVGVFFQNGVYAGSIDTEDGPAGVAVATATSRLYVYNRIEGTVQSFDIASATTLPTAALASARLSDPTYDDVREGRRIFNTPNSGNGATNCASCHPEARKDGLAWNLQKFFDLPPGPATAWQDLKGVMVTQDLRNLEGIAPYHWRGEQKDVDDFNGAFTGLLQGSLLTQGQMDLLERYFFSCNFPPNPLQQMNRVFSPLGQTGFTEYSTPYLCNGCHLLPTGTDCSMTEVILGLPFETRRMVESAHLVGLWTKASDTVNTDDANPNPANEVPLAPSTGFGLAHEGVVDSLDQFNRNFFPTKNIPALNQFVNEMDSGLAPFTSYCRTLDQATAGNVQRITGYMIPQAAAGNGDLVASGRLRLGGVWTPVGLLYFPGTQVFEADTTSLGSFSFATLRTMAQSGDAELLFYGVPAWSGERIALDRDRDGVRDGDEVAQGLDPRSPDSDGDGLWDGYDPFPLNPGPHILPANPPGVVPGSLQLVFINTNNAKLQFETTSWSPTIVEFGETSALGFFYGDGFLATGPANRSNLWKRKHTAFLRPQPAQGLPGLRDGTAYQFSIWTQGQNGVTLETVAAIQPQTVSDDATNARTEMITVVGVANGNGTHTYTATVDLIQNTGQPVTASNCIPGRFAIYDTAGNFTLVPLAVTASGSQAIFTHTTSPGQQVTGDLTRFDIPMWLTVTDCNGNPPNVDVPVFFPGRWPEGPSTVDVLAP